MLRRSNTTAFRRTLINTMAEPPKIYMDGGHEWGAYDASEAPSADDAVGIFVIPYNGPFKFLRLIEPGWWASRAMHLNRKTYLGNVIIWMMTYMFLWYIPCRYLYGDGKPPREVDWNDEKAGYFP